MKKFFAFILTLAMILTLCVSTAVAAQVSRCPLCGAENAMVWYNSEYGYCRKCHRSTDTVSLTVNVKSDALSFEQVELAIYKNGRVERLSYVPSGKQTICFDGLQKGFYTVCAKMNGCVPIVYNVWLYNSQTATFYMHLRGDINGDGVVDAFDFHMLDNHLNHKHYLYGLQYQYADINGDFRVNNKDLDGIKTIVFD